MRESDLILFVVDAQHGLAPVDQELAAMLRKSRRRSCSSSTRSIDPKHEALEADFARLGFDRTVSISAAHGRGISELARDDRRTAAGRNVERRTSRRRTSNRRSRSRSSAGRMPASRRSSMPSCAISARSSANIPGHDARRGRHRLRARRRKFLLIDTAGMRARSKHSTSVEVFSVMRAERTIRRADLCVLVIDADQRRHVAGQKDRRPDPGIAQAIARCPEQVGPGETAARRKEPPSRRLVDGNARGLVLPRLRAGAGRFRGDRRKCRRSSFEFISQIQRAAGARIGTGVLESHAARAPWTKTRRR